MASGTEQESHSAPNVLSLTFLSLSNEDLHHILKGLVEWSFYSVIPLVVPQFRDETIEDRSSCVGNGELEVGFESGFNFP